MSVGGWGTDQVEKQAPRRVKPTVGETATLESYETRNPHPSSSMQGEPLKSHMADG